MKIKKNKIKSKKPMYPNGGYINKYGVGGSEQDWGNANTAKPLNAGAQYGAAFGQNLASGLPSVVNSYTNPQSTAADKTRATAQMTGDAAVSAVPGFGAFYGTARGITSSIQDAIPGKDMVDKKTGVHTNVKKSSVGRAADQWLTPDHTHASNSWALAAGADNSADKAKYAMMGIGDLFGVTKIARVAQSALGKSPEGMNLVDPKIQAIQEANSKFPTVNPNMPENTNIMDNGGFGGNKTNTSTHLLEKYKVLPHSQLNPNFANAQLDGKPIQLEKDETIFRAANGGNYAFSPNIIADSGKTIAAESIAREKLHKKPYYDKASEDTLKFSLNQLVAENESKRIAKEQKGLPKADEGMSASELGNESLNDDGVARNWMWNNIIQNENSYDPYGYRKTTNIGFQQRPSDNINVEKFDSNLSQNNVQLGNFSRVEGPNTKQLRNSINWDNKKTQVNNNLTTGDYLQLAGQIPALAYNTGMAFRKPEKQKLYQDLSPITPNQQSIDLNPMFLAQNNAFKTVNEGTTSDAVRRANLANITSGTQRNMADALLQNKNLNASLRGQFEQRLADRSRFNIAQKLGVDDINAKNRAAQRMFGATAATNLGQGLTNFGLAKNQGKTNEIQYSTLQSLASNYGLDPKEYADFLKSKGIKIKYK